MSKGKIPAEKLPHVAKHQMCTTDGMVVPAVRAVLLCGHEAPPESQFGSNSTGK